MLRFSLDIPASAELTPITRFGGWYLPDEGRRLRLVLRLDGRPWASLQTGIHRPDVLRYLPQAPAALFSGFAGDLVLPEGTAPGASVEISIQDEGGPGGPVEIARRIFTVCAGGPVASRRERVFDLREVFAWPAEDGGSPAPGVRCHLRLGCPHFLREADLPTVKVTQDGASHPYSKAAEEVIGEAGEGLILDFGAGEPEEALLRPNVLLLDVHQFRSTDVACGTPRLPFRDAVFEAIISQATFEHLPDPAATARELFRVLRPGGRILIDTAFLQPLHGDPGHFFNMTREGLRKVMAPFEEIRSGVQPHQAPSFGLRLAAEAVRPLVSDESWGRRIDEFRAWINREGASLDEALGPAGREIVAAGVFYLGRRPADPV